MRPCKSLQRHRGGQRQQKFVYKPPLLPLLQFRPSRCPPLVRARLLDGHGGHVRARAPRDAMSVAGRIPLEDDLTHPVDARRRVGERRGPFGMSDIICSFLALKLLRL